MAGEWVLREANMHKAMMLVVVALGLPLARNALAAVAAAAEG